MLQRSWHHIPAARAITVVLVGAVAWAGGLASAARAVIIEGDSSIEAIEAREEPSGSPDWAVPGCDGAEFVIADDPGTDWDRIVLDPVRRLPPGWEPADLVDIPVLGRHTNGQVRAIIVDDLVAMHAAAAAAGVEFDVVSGFRSDAHQDDVYASHNATLPPEDADGPPMVAPPGHSEHQLGTTIDVVHPGEPTLSVDFGSRPAAAWLDDHAADHGFIVSYPAGEQATTCYGWEPWHLRWVGADRAREIDSSGLSPREFLLREAAGQLP